MQITITLYVSICLTYGFISELFAKEFRSNVLHFAFGISKSHVLFNERLANVLSENGYNVHIVFAPVAPGVDLPDFRNNKNVKVIKINFTTTDIFLTLGKQWQKNIFKKDSVRNIFAVGRMFQKLLIDSCKILSKSSALKQQIETIQYDVLLTYCLDICPLAFGWKGKIPKTICISPSTVIFESVASIVGTPIRPSFIPNGGSAYSDKMTFFDRLCNSLLSFLMLMYPQLPISAHKIEENIFKTVHGNDYKSIKELNSNIAGMLINGEASLEFPRPLLPTVIYLGDLLPPKSSQLSTEWQHVVEAENAGIILFSFGSVINANFIPWEIKKELLDAFSRFPNYTIVCKLSVDESHKYHLPPNVKLFNWIPQRELLDHPKLKLFITHGGYNSLLETAKVGVPMITIPLFGDQMSNALRAERKKLSLVINKLEITSENLEKKMKILLEDNTYFDRAKQFAGFIHDKPLSNADMLIRYMDITIRRQKIIKSAVLNLNTIQEFNLDSVILATSAFLVLLSLVR
ncbi:putative UDP-glucuronosyltransferase ugt-60 [Trichinella pseudospiralis]|uniref:UDP-glucuronosyltransferase n=1 Tax=Trichinella pseudospiralis TaxID=6337 RepID=A0A0V1FYE7_TRIPS|nr:putative UDP-glucuronosyltransferase ugt-60 [Trichinella pseudospiralis]